MSPAAGRREKRDFLRAVRRDLRDHPELPDAGETARIVFGVIAMHVTAGEIGKIVDALPREIRALWPKISVHSLE